VIAWTGLGARAAIARVAGKILLATVRRGRVAVTPKANTRHRASAGGTGRCCMGGWANRRTGAAMVDVVASVDLATVRGNAIAIGVVGVARLVARTGRTGRCGIRWTADVAAAATIGDRTERRFTAVLCVAIAVASVAAPHVAGGTSANARGVVVTAYITARAAVRRIRG